MKQKNTLQWLSIVAGKTKLLVGVLVAIQAVLSVSSIAFAFVLRRIINMAVDGAQGGFWASLALLMGILLGQIMLSATGRFLSEYTAPLWKTASSTGSSPPCLPAIMRPWRRCTPASG